MGLVPPTPTDRGPWSGMAGIIAVWLISQERVRHTETDEVQQLCVLGTEFTLCTGTIQILERSLKRAAGFKGPPSTGSFGVDSLLL